MQLFTAFKVTVLSQHRTQKITEQFKSGEGYKRTSKVLNSP